MATNTLCNVFYQPAVRQAVTGPSADPVFRRLVLGWIDRQTDDNTLSRVLAVAADVGLTKEANGLALKVVRQKRGGPQGTAQALVILAKAGGKEHLALFESFLSDRGSVSSFGIGGAAGNFQGKTELRDVA